MARTDRSAPKHRGISFFLFDMRLPGVEIRPLRQMTGGSEFDEVFFTDVMVPADCLLGPLNGGWDVGMAVLTNERGHIGAAVIGLERRLAAISAMGDSGRSTPSNASGSWACSVGAGPSPPWAHARDRRRRRRRR